MHTCTSPLAMLRRLEKLRISEEALRDYSEIDYLISLTRGYLSPEECIERLRQKWRVSIPEFNRSLELEGYRLMVNSEGFREFIASMTKFLSNYLRYTKDEKYLITYTVLKLLGDLNTEGKMRDMDRINEVIEAATREYGEKLKHFRAILILALKGYYFWEEKVGSLAFLRPMPKSRCLVGVAGYTTR